MGKLHVAARASAKGEKSDKFKKRTKLYILSSKTGELELESCRDDVFLYHLRVLQVLNAAQRGNDVRSYHFALLRQVLENKDGHGRVDFLGSYRSVCTARS